MQVHVENFLESGFPVREEQVGPLAMHHTRTQSTRPTLRAALHMHAPTWSGTSSSPTRCSLGTTNTCPGLTGYKSMKAITRSSSYTT